MLALEVQQAPRTGAHVLVQVVGWRHGRPRGGWVVRVTEMSAAPTQVVVLMIVVLKELVFTGSEVIEGLLF